MYFENAIESHTWGVQKNYAPSVINQISTIQKNDLICLIPHCNVEAYILIALYYFSSKYSKKLLCRMVFRLCEKHVRMISGDEIVVKIQILN